MLLKLLFVLSVLLQDGSEVPEKYTRYLKRLDQAKAETIEYWNTRLQKAKDSRPKNSKQKQERSAEMAEAREKIEACEKNRIHPRVELPVEMKPNDIGVFIQTGRIVQVVNKSEMIYEAAWLVPSVEVQGNLVSTSHKAVEINVWISGIDTAGLTDDTYHKLPTVFEVKGTKQYQTLAGNRTIFEIEPTDVKLLKKYLPNPTIEEDQPKEAEKKVDLEKIASSKLRLAKLLKSKPEIYKARLEEIVEMWPETEAGKEAKELLED